jgi:3-methyladenine DNA glycosylase AlkD
LQLRQKLVEIQASLLLAVNEKDKKFFIKMVPGKQKVYGVKTPILNELAKKYKEYSFDLAELLWSSASLEERIIAIKIMEKKGKYDPNRLLKLFKQFAGTTDNWAVCDGLGMQFLRGIIKTHVAEIFEIAQKFNKDKNFWKRRLSLVMVEWYTRNTQHHIEIKKLVKNLENDDEYYVKKAVIWITKNFQKGK